MNRILLFLFIFSCGPVFADGPLELNVSGEYIFPDSNALFGISADLVYLPVSIDKNKGIYCGFGLSAGFNLSPDYFTAEDDSYAFYEDIRHDNILFPVNILKSR